MAPFTRHIAGCDTALRFVMSLNLIKAGLDETRSDFLSRFIEFWCQRNCLGNWRVLETSKFLNVCFDLPRDVVLFKISEEYSYFSRYQVPVVFDDNSPKYSAFLI